MAGARVIVSLFPGIDGLGRGFAEVFPDACLLRGPDLIYGTDIREWHLAEGIAWGVIAGPPCQTFSPLARLIRAQGRALFPNDAEIVTAVDLRLRWLEAHEAERGRSERLAVVVDNFLNVDLPNDECAFCDYDAHSVTPFDGHAQDCPIRRLAEAA